MADEPKPEGFIEGSSLTILNRNLYFNRDFRKGQLSRTGNGFSEEWAHGIIDRAEWYREPLARIADQQA